jgi:hypothetical protein
LRTGSASSRSRRTRHRGSIVGDLDQQLSNWETTFNGQGRIRQLKNRYQGSIEVIQWQDLVNDAWMRNQATLHAAGLSRSQPANLATAVALPQDEDVDEDGEALAAAS